nr:hypothetical protein [Pseudactinotalea terrae]
MLSPEQAEAIVGDVDPAVRSEAAHTTATAIVHGGRAASDDAALVERLVSLVDTEGIDTVAALWADSPAETLPGALWRLYLLREWTRRDPRTIAERYQLGVARAEVAGAVAGVADAPGPEEIRTLADAVLSGVFRGDLDVALERAGAFCRVLATGSALDADSVATSSGHAATRITRHAGALLGTAEELEQAAALWRAERLD